MDLNDLTDDELRSVAGFLDLFKRIEATPTPMDEDTRKVLTIQLSALEKLTALLNVKIAAESVQPNK